MNVVYVTGNAHKAKYFNKMVGLDIPHHSVDVEEIQSLDLRAIVEHKAREAYRQLKQPVIVEDTSLTFEQLGKLPGPFIKWFLDELGIDGLAELGAKLNDKSAVAGAMIAYFDGKTMKVFSSQLEGKLSDKPKGDNGFGWNQIFIPDGQKLTLGEMDDETFKQYYGRVKPFAQLRKFLTK